jgi:hypothetical protein
VTESTREAKGGTKACKLHNGTGGCGRGGDTHLNAAALAGADGALGGGGGCIGFGVGRRGKDGGGGGM